jgi:hypothetical protein
METKAEEGPSKPGASNYIHSMVTVAEENTGTAAKRCT